MKKVIAKQENTSVSTTVVKEQMASKKEGYESAGIPVDRLLICNGLPLSVE